MIYLCHDEKSDLWKPNLFYTNKKLVYFGVNTIVPSL